MKPRVLPDTVATRVMGWSLAERDWAYSDRAKVWLDAGGAVAFTHHAWRPEEDDTQSMQVFDRLVALGYAVQLSATAGAVTVKVQREGGTEAVASAPDRRRAVLLAAAEL